MSHCKPRLKVGLIGTGFMGVAGCLEAMNGDRPEPFDCRSGPPIQTLAEQVQRSGRERCWLSVEG